MEQRVPENYMRIVKIYSETRAQDKITVGVKPRGMLAIRVKPHQGVSRILFGNSLCAGSGHRKTVPLA